MVFRYEVDDCVTKECIRNYRKVPPKPVPQFVFTGSQMQITSTTTTAQEPTVTESIANLITDIITNNATTINTKENENITITTDTLESSTNINEIVNSNYTSVIDSIMGASTNSTIIDKIGSSSTTIVNDLSTNTTNNNNSILTTLSEFVNSSINSIVIEVKSTTSESPALVNQHRTESMHHPTDIEGHKFLYIILIIILAVLILIGIILLLIYIRSRKATHHMRSYYDIRPSYDKTGSITENSHELKERINDLYMFQKQC